MEVRQVFHITGAPAPSPSLGGDIQHSVKVSRGYTSCFSETGCTQILVHQTLVRPRALLEAEWVEIRCVHGMSINIP